MTSERAGIPDVGVVIVNYRTADRVLECLQSVATERAGLQLRAAVVDAASGDGSADHLRRELARRHWGDWVEIVECERNGGYGHGLNRGIARLGACRFLLMLNSDIRFERPVLERCIEVLETRPGTGVMSCRLLQEDGSVQTVARRFPTASRLLIPILGIHRLWPGIGRRFDIDDLSWDRAAGDREVDWLGGAFLLARPEAIAQIGGFDEDYFFYGEDADLCWRLRRAGWKVRYAGDPAVIHAGGASSDPTRLAPAVRRLHRHRGTYLFLLKTRGRVTAGLVRGLDLLCSCARLAVLTVSGRRRIERAQELRERIRHLTTPLHLGEAVDQVPAGWQQTGPSSQE